MDAYGMPPDHAEWLPERKKINSTGIIRSSNQRERKKKKWTNIQKYQACVFVQDGGSLAPFFF